MIYVIIVVQFLIVLDHLLDHFNVYARITWYGVGIQLKIMEFANAKILKNFQVALDYVSVIQQFISLKQMDLALVARD